MEGIVTENIFLYLFVFSVFNLVLGFMLKGILTSRKLGNTKLMAQQILEQAKVESEKKIKEAKIEAKDELLKAKIDFENETKERRKELNAIEKRVLQKEENVDRKLDILDKREQAVNKKEKTLETKDIEYITRQKELERIIKEETDNLLKISTLTKDEARKMVLEKLDEELKKESSALIRQAEADTKTIADKKAKEIISLAIQRCAGEHSSETTIATVPLPNDEMKGRIIGREGRNIRALEAATGVDVIIDDTPEAVVLSSFDNVRKEIARITLERLILDGRIHPARIEEVVEKVKKEIEESIKEAGEQAAFDVGIHGLHPEIIKLLGRLKYRTSYGQNVLQHSIEAAHLMGIMAAELSFDVRIAKRAGLLHDIGKSMDREVEGSHAVIGADFAKKFGESPDIVHAIRAHHGDEEPKTTLAVLCAASDAISGARPGARSESLQSYIKRLENLEDVAKGFRGVDKAFAIQAGREVRVMVEPVNVDDTEMVYLSRKITKKIQDSLEYPGQIKVTVIRESRAVEYAK